MIQELIVVAISITLANANDDGNYTVPFNMEEGEKCAKELGISEAELDEYFDRDPLVLGEGKIRCFLSCFMQGKELMDDSGQLTQKLDFNRLSKECVELNETYRTGTKKGDICERAFNFWNCLFSASDGDTT